MLQPRLGSKLVYRSSHYNIFESTVLASEFLPDTEFIGNDMIVEGYRKAIQNQRDLIESTFINLYGRKMKVSHGKVSEMYLKIKAVNNTFSKSITEIGVEIKKYLGQKDMNFIKPKEKNPIFLTTIIQAYEMVKLKKPKLEIEKYLFT